MRIATSHPSAFLKNYVPESYPGKRNVCLHMNSDLETRKESGGDPDLIRFISKGMNAVTKKNVLS
jgi:hypothetical protein